MSSPDLFDHSYTTPPPQPVPTSKSQWFWVPTATVWDASAEKFLARLSEVKRFGGEAKGEFGKDWEVRQMTEADLRHKLNRNQEDRRKMNLQQQDQESMLCYNCHQTGHHKSQCSNPSFCCGCKQTAHISSKCPNAKSNKELRLCNYGMPGQLFYSLNILEEKGEEKTVTEKSLSAIVIVYEGRVLNLLGRMGKIKFICFDIQASMVETDRDTESFDMLKTDWVKAIGIPKLARKEVHVMELDYLVGDPEKFFLESLNSKENESGKPSSMQDVNQNNEDEAIDEDEPESQSSYGALDNEWLKARTPPTHSGAGGSKTTDQGKQAGGSNKKLARSSPWS
ncbi:hypothetical protein PAHAL_3G426700 [Panicum hallii]|uniref:CCHC-type domain-containing protein n=1 Tax=Panicum hallii TaxID=206008 RepID=A0A2T8KL95_9POAL|nr:hypothetical protein PAHAL_3G426700 [Panicum hallii]